MSIDKQKLIDTVIESLRENIANGDFTVLEELLGFIPTNNLIESLSEEQWKDFESLRVPVRRIGETIYTIGELKDFLTTLDGHDLTVMETIDENGDTCDLFPFHMDVIDNIELLDGTIVREVRFCQEKNILFPEDQDEQQ
jgi:hypothetical protein